MSAEGSTATEVPFNRPQTAQEVAAAAEKKKRNDEMAELRKLRAEQTAKDDSVHLTPAEAARKKREEELEEMRRLKADDFEENRRRLAEKGGALTTDMDAWRHNQLDAKNADKRKKAEAQSGLHGHRGKADTTKNALKDLKDADRKQKLEAENYLHGYTDKAALSRDDTTGSGGSASAAEKQMAGLSVGGEGGSFDNNSTGSGSGGGANPPAKDKVAEKQPSSRGVMFKEAPDEEIPVPEKKKGLDADNLDRRVSFDSPESEAKAAEAKQAPAAQQEAPAAETKQAPAPQEAPAAADADVAHAHTYALKAPTYSRVDIKFSFGLIVRSSHADGFDGENLRENETLKKCMDATSKILKDQMPSPPDASQMERGSFNALKISFPEAYYDPTLEPNVISIEEDMKSEQEATKKTAKGNKRTLVKASFPVFMRDEPVDDEGKKRSARILKETKTTVFKALRAAVSGGSFLR